MNMNILAELFFQDPEKCYVFQKMNLELGIVSFWGMLFLKSVLISDAYTHC